MGVEEIRKWIMESSVSNIGVGETITLLAEIDRLREGNRNLIRIIESEKSRISLLQSENCGLITKLQSAEAEIGRLKEENAILGKRLRAVDPYWMEERYGK